MKTIFKYIFLATILLFKFSFANALSINLSANQINDYGYACSWYDIEIEVAISGISPDYLVGYTFLDGTLVGGMGSFDSLEVVDFNDSEQIWEGVKPCNTHLITYVLAHGAYGTPDYSVVQSTSTSVTISCHNVWGCSDLDVFSKEFYDDYVAPLELVTVEGNMEITANDLSAVPELINLTSILGSLHIESTSITDLSGLSSLEDIAYQVTIVGNPNLHDISFINNIQNLGDYVIGLAFFDSLDANSFRPNIENLYIGLDYVNGFTDLRFLGNVNFIDNITLIECNDFEDFSGMTNMTSIGEIRIENCSNFDSLNGLSSLTSIGELLVLDNTQFNDFCGAQQLIDNNVINAFDQYILKERIGGMPTYYTEQEIRDLCSPPVACQYDDIDPSHYAFDAVSYLCNNGLLDDDDSCHADDRINRAELAKLAYLSIGLQNMAVADTFPSPFQDLQDTTTWYYSYAKNLSYLEYRDEGELDGVSPFDKTFYNFYPSDSISRAHALKVLLETWNVELQYGTDLPFTDIDTLHDAYQYVYTAYQLGIIDDNLQHVFGPDVMAYRGEIFDQLYRMMDALSLPNPDPIAADFFIPGNYTPGSFASYRSMHSGNFNFYTKSSFAISSIGIPLNFEHTYNSYLSEMPRELMPILPLGEAWSHPYNSYVIEIDGDITRPDDFRVIVALPGNGYNVFYLDNGSYISETKGVYLTLEKPSGTQFTLKTKDQIVYTYEKLSGSNTTFPYVLISVHDRNNNTLEIDYEPAIKTGFFRISQVTGTAGRTLDFSYHTSTDLLEKVTDPLNRTIHFAYDTYNVLYQKPRLIEFTDAKGQISTYSYGPHKRDECLLMTIDLPKGNTITNTYEQKKLTSTQTNGIEKPQTFNYKRQYGQSATNGYSITESTDPSGKETITQFNKNGNPNQVTTPTSDISVNYNASHTGKPDNITIDSKTIGYTYDTIGNVLSMALPLSVTHQFTYNRFNDVTQYTDPRGKVYSYTYDTNGNQTEVATPRGITTFSRNDQGLVTSSTNPSGITVTFGYDTYGNQISTSAPEGITTSSIYDDASRLTEFTNPLNQTISYAYDDNDNLLNETFNSQMTQYNYDPNDNLNEIINALGRSTTMRYDQNDFLTSITFESHKDSFAYHDDGRLKTKIDPNGNIFSNGYDSEYRLDTIASGSEAVSYTYDANNNITTVTNNSGTTTFTYDALNRVTQTTDFWGNTVDYSYDLSGNITTITYPGDKTVTYTYDDDNLMHSVTDWNSHTTTYTYLDDSRLSRIDYPNGTFCVYNYDLAGRMIGLNWKKSTNDTICAYSYTLDALGNHLSETTTEPYTNFSIPIQNTSYTYNNDNRIASAGSTVFDFDENGNTIEKGSRDYVYNRFDLLTTVSGDSSYQFTYNGNGNRVAASRNGTITRYVLDLLGMTNVLMETDGSDNPIHYYVYGLGLIARIDVSENTRYYHYDFRGSTIAMTDESENITHSYQYGDFGEVLQMQEADFNPYRYVGKFGVMFEDSSLYYMRARYFDSDIGRFLSEDPVWSTNLYPYAENNPVNYIDPKGKSKREPYYQIYEESSDVSNLFIAGMAGDTEEILKFIIKEKIKEIEKEIIRMGDEATMYYAEQFVKSDKWYQKVGWGIAGGFSSLVANEEAYYLTKQTLTFALLAKGKMSKKAGMSKATKYSGKFGRVKKINDFKSKNLDPAADAIEYVDRLYHYIEDTY